MHPHVASSESHFNDDDHRDAVTQLGSKAPTHPLVHGARPTYRVTIYSRPRSSVKPVPERCDRCGLRIGTTHVHFTASPGSHLVRAGANSLWLCDECRGEIVSRAADN
jgi:hypothetical protein